MALFWQKGNKDVKPVAKTEKADKKMSVAKVSAKTDKKDASTAEKRAAATQGGVIFEKGSAILKPRVTEKAGMLAEKGVYTFEVQKTANSQEISAAIKAAYKVTPTKISIAPIKSKAMFSRGRSGRTVSGKKAYVYLAKGDKIEFI
jgi:large subunit ribosomal protein L23